MVYPSLPPGKSNTSVMLSEGSAESKNLCVARGCVRYRTARIDEAEIHRLRRGAAFAQDDAGAARVPVWHRVGTAVAPRDVSFIV